MPIKPARRVGFRASNLSRTSCHVRAFWANALAARTRFSRSPKQRPFLKIPKARMSSSFIYSGGPLNPPEVVRQNGKWASKVTRLLDLVRQTALASGNTDGLRERRRRGSAAEVFVGDLSNGQKLCVFDSPSCGRRRRGKRQGRGKQEKVGRKGSEGGWIRCGCRRNSCTLSVFDQNLLIVQIIGHRDDEKEDHQGAAHGHQFADITRRAPQGCSAARQREDLRENRSDGHADPDQVECQLHNLSDYSMHAGAAKQQKGDCGAGESTRRASPYFLEQPATEALEASALVLSRACLLRGQWWTSPPERQRAWRSATRRF